MGEPFDLGQLLSRIVDALHLCIVIDKHGTIRYISKNYAEILGYQPQEVVGKYIPTVIPNTRLLEVLHTGRSILGDIFMLGNGELTVCNRFPLLDEHGNVEGAFSSATFEKLEVIGKLGERLERLQQENLRYKSQLQRLKNIGYSMESVIGVSPAITSLKETIIKVAGSDLSVLLTGETGVGKEVFANALHQLSHRNFGPYIKVNCAAIPKDLLESELFGYDSGAFSGASKGGKPGKFELANQGTILLDEIGELPLPLQSKLLRVLQEREVERVGGSKPIKLDVRVISCTNQNLEPLIEQGAFRRDLFYRINVVELQIPPLRNRLEDIEPLCKFLVEQINHNHGCATTGLSQEVLQTLLRYHWPGNVRELEHVLERAAVMAPTGQLELEHFDFFLPRVYNASLQPPERPNVLSDYKRQAECDAIRNALRKTMGNKTKAAQLLQIPRSLLYEKIKRYQIDVD